MHNQVRPQTFHKHEATFTKMHIINITGKIFISKLSDDVNQMCVHCELTNIMICGDKHLIFSPLFFKHG